MKKGAPSPVEAVALEKSGFEMRYAPTEKMGVVQVANFPMLGKLIALRFLEWTQSHAGGVVSLPTGKTPEYFIRYVQRYLQGWNRPEVRAELEAGGIDPAVKPDVASLRFVQIDEFYPMDPAHNNSFYYFIDKYYMEGFGLDRNKAMLIDGSRIGMAKGWDLDSVWPDGSVDLSLRIRHPKTKLERVQKDVLEAVDQWCFDYDEKIRKMGGIGFFLGGIGPDGHIAFNIQGSDHNSTTRLIATNYETQAAAASDLGGIEVARKRLAITIGLETITHDPECAAIIIAAGEAKASMVARAIQSPAHIRHPASVLHKLPNARFYITGGAAKRLDERQVILFQAAEAVTPAMEEKAVVDLSLKLGKAITDIKPQEMKKDPFCKNLLDRGLKADELLSGVRQRLVDKIEEGRRVKSGQRFLHTAPHHDDLMLGIFPPIIRHIRDPKNSHMFTYMTSGFTAVTNHYALSRIQDLKYFLTRPEFTDLFDENYFDPANRICRNRDVWQYLDGVAADNDDMQREGEARRLLRNLMEVFEEENPKSLENRIDELVNYFETQYAGKKDLPHIQKLKGLMREWEADCLWGYLGFDSSSVEHLRLGFYKGDIFTEEPTAERDVPPILALLRKMNPNVVSVAFDPEASGPDTHYKVLQAVAEALRRYEAESGRSDIEVWGYRNVWYRFQPSEADLFVPVSLNMLALMESSFMNAFASQRQASFPSFEYNGPFSGLAQKIQVEQYQKLKTCLGRHYFNEHPSPLIRATRGFVYLKKMSMKTFYSHARALKERAESVQ